MPKYDVYVQGAFYKTIDAPVTNNALTRVTLDIQAGLVPNFDHTQPSQIELRPAANAASSSAAPNQSAS